MTPYPNISLICPHCGYMLYPFLQPFEPAPAHCHFIPHPDAPRLLPDETDTPLSPFAKDCPNHGKAFTINFSSIAEEIAL